MKKSQPIRVIAAHRAVFAMATEPRRGMGEREVERGVERGIHGMRKDQNMMRARQAGERAHHRDGFNGMC